MHGLAHHCPLIHCAVVAGYGVCYNAIHTPCPYVFLAWPGVILKILS